jgi:hypothetical protein
MVRSAWLRSAGPGLVAVAAVGLLASTTIGARERPWEPPECAGTAPDGAARVTDMVVRGDPGTPAPWFRLDPVLDPNGALTGQRLVVGRIDGTGRRFLDLPPESAAAGPIGGAIVVATDDGSVSRVLALDVVASCATTLDVSADIVRRATIAPDGRSLVEARVDRRSRADLGIWRRTVGGGGPAVRWLEPIAADARFGRTWATDLVWSVAGTELAIQSCGELACRTRVVETATGSVRLVDDPDLGPAIGVSDGRLVAYLACRGTPCPIVAFDVGTGIRRILVADSGPAVLTATDAGPRLVHRASSVAGPILRSLALDGRDDRMLGPIPDGLDLLTDPTWSEAGAGRPDGWVVLVPHGRMPRNPADSGLLLRHALDGRSATLEEVTR